MSARNAVRNVRGTGAKEFIKVLENIDQSRRPWDVFADWTVMASGAIYNRIFNDPKVEDEYLAVAKRYDAAAMQQMSELLAIATEALSDGPQDFLGEVFEGCFFTNDNHGQFFTPYPVSLMLAEITLGAIDKKDDRILTISEPACGAGGMALAACQVLEDQGINYAAMVSIEAQDIDSTCARMTYIQLSLVGAAAVVSCGDTIRMTEHWAWPTPAYVFNEVEPRLQRQRAIDAMLDLVRGEAPCSAQAPGARTPAEEDRAIRLPAGRGSDAVQLELFEGIGA